MFSLKHKILFFIALSSFFKIRFSKFAELIIINETFYNTEFIDVGKSVLWMFGGNVFTYFKHTRDCSFHYFNIAVDELGFGLIGRHDSEVIKI